ncbi:hypothetical protein ASPTUDRAFT_37069 [Aspergillus tubingensis CBS 134.48]|uniref:Uncharacterized protein n=1 Tax=Aspergillus tubingensis (strain CBS 134.48) TaxID=767770 RepID=A0A1L9NMG0_ASPTC|nr:hypothetical protein ASPTUDRAFT_37069 [Aspergillus tubingensis CBS 134.48]
MSSYDVQLSVDFGPDTWSGKLLPVSNTARGLAENCSGPTSANQSSLLPIHLGQMHPSIDGFGSAITTRGPHDKHPPMYYPS